MVLLLASCVFYLSLSPKYIIFVLITAASIYFSARQMGKIDLAQKAWVKENSELSSEEKKAGKKAFQKKRKVLFVLTLVLNFGLLVFFKYSPFLSSQVSGLFSLFGVKIPVLQSIVAPLGISFYTFQSTGYLVEVYWKNYKAEKNFFKFLLFTSFFPQIIQGPINRYDSLSVELFTEHSFDYVRFLYGCQRMLWGFLKKIVLADRLAPYVSDIFSNYSNLTGYTLLIGAFMYSAQIYADFSGYMDIMCGFCEILGIKLSENFERPYFSKSVAEYWRRWHITLGTWFKDYIYYPIGVSKFSRNLSKKSQKIFGTFLGRNIPAIFALVVVWSTTGLWHGASWNYIGWGFLNGFFIILSILCEPLYKGAIETCGINEKSRLWAAFQTIRTFILITLIKVFPEVGPFHDGVGYMKRMFSTLGMLPHSLGDVLIAQKGSMDYLCILAMVCVMFIVSMIQRKQPFRVFIGKQHRIIRWGLYLAAVLFLLYFGGSVVSNGGFMYAQF